MKGQMQDGDTWCPERTDQGWRPGGVLEEVYGGSLIRSGGAEASTVLRDRDTLVYLLMNPFISPHLDRA